MPSTPSLELLAQIGERINTIGDPCSVANGTPMGLTDMGILGDVSFDEDGCAHVDLRLTSPSCYMVGYFTEQIKTCLAELPEIADVVVHADHGLDWMPSMMSEDAKRRRREGLAARGIAVSVGLSGAEGEWS